MLGVKVYIDGVLRDIDAPSVTLAALLQAHTRGQEPAAPVVVASLDGRLVDLSTRLDASDIAYVLEFVDAHDPRGRDVVRHSTIHLAAQAVQRLFGAQSAHARRIPQGVGPVTQEGFYQDFDAEAVGRTLTEADFPAIEAMMLTIAGEGHQIARLEVSKEDARELFADDPLKQELLDRIPDPIVSVYDAGAGYIDLCRGPHVPTSRILRHFKLHSCSRAYWMADASRPQLTRIYGTAYGTAEELELDTKCRAEAARRDHRRIGKEMRLFELSDVAPGAVFYQPNGAVVRQLLIDDKRRLLTKYGFDEVVTPTMMRRELWQRSGHWEHYRANMFLVASGEAAEAGQDPDYAIKPMNCPGHIVLFESERRSYRDLPIRYAEFGTVHRNELHGALTGLLRVRAFTQDDAHLFVTAEQLADEVTQLINMYQELYDSYVFTSVKIIVSTRPDERLGTDSDWDAAEGALFAALNHVGMSYTVNAGDGTFYGPKIDFHIADSLGRSWQCGTIQVDMQLPARFDLSYVDRDGALKRPIMIHPATMGSLERFLAILIEHFEGKFPTWLAPVQALVVSVSAKAEVYGREVVRELRHAGLRARGDFSDERLAKKILNAQPIRAPYILVVGQVEATNHTVSIRDRQGREQRSIPLDAFIQAVIEEVADRQAEPLMTSAFVPSRNESVCDSSASLT